MQCVEMRCVERGPVIKRGQTSGFPRLVAGRPDWDYNTRRMVSRRILGRPMFQLDLSLNQTPKDQESSDMAIRGSPSSFGKWKCLRKCGGGKPGWYLACRWNFFCQHFYAGSIFLWSLFPRTCCWLLHSTCATTLPPLFHFLRSPVENGK